MGNARIGVSKVAGVEADLFADFFEGLDAAAAGNGKAREGPNQTD
jgi:hypothetical protein